MVRRYCITCLLVAILLASCDSSLTNSISEHPNEKQTSIKPTKEFVDNNFNDFIEKFSTDSIFQVNRVKFPLKIERQEIGEDSLFFIDRSDFKMMDFRQKKSKGQYDRWEQKIVIEKNNASATIKILGIDNGIMMDYFFEKIDGAWMIVEIVDKST